MKLGPDATRSSFYRQLEELDQPVIMMNDVYPEIVTLKK